MLNALVFFVKAWILEEADLVMKHKNLRKQSGADNITISFQRYPDATGPNGLMQIRTRS